MKLGRESSRKLAAALERRRFDIGVSYSDLAVATNVHPSQVSRICRGQFVTRTDSVVRICNFLGVTAESGTTLPTEGASPERPVEEVLKRKVVESALEMWDRTPEGAERLVRLFRDLVDLTTPSLRSTDRN